MSRAKAFLRGMLSIFDFSFDSSGAALFDSTGFPPKPEVRILSDEEAMAADWQAVGDDIRAAIGQYERKHAQF